MDRFRVLVHDYSGSEDSETLFEICDLYSDSDQSEIDTKNDDETSSAGSATLGDTS